VIPTSDVGSVRENDVPAAEVPGVLGVDGHTLRLTSGRYTFTAST
jgi:alpha-L-rhamnosidase